jgi:preprotein translocase subunit SecE
VSEDQARTRTSPAVFLREVRAELKKVSWPSREQIVSYTVVVLVITTVLTTLIWGVDEVIRRTVLNTLG